MGKKLLKWIGIVIGCLVLLAAVAFGVGVVTGYDPEDIEKISDGAQSDAKLNLGDEVKIMTWNVGYSALDETADFFMDGGKMVNTATKQEVMDNLAFFKKTVEAENPDILFLQEVDVNSKRSHHVNEYEYMNQMDSYISTFAHNFKVRYIPYPIPNIGKVESGIATYQKYSLLDSERIQLYCPFNRIVRAFNLRRCLMVNRIPIEDSEKELVLVNLHLEAYDSGEGKIKQTQQLREILVEELEKGNYVVAGGDFNQIFSNVDLGRYPQIREDLWMPAQIEEGLFDDFTFVTDDSVPTCRSLHEPYQNVDKEHFQYYVIDGFIVSDNLEIVQIETKDLQFSHSDHNPVVLQIKLK